MAARRRIPAPPSVANLADAIKYADPNAVWKLLEKGHDPNIHIESGTFLLEQACQMKATEIVKTLLKFGSDPDLSGFENGDIRPLHIAATNGNVEIIEELINAGVNIEAADKRGWTALHRAVARGNYQAVKTLIQHGANPDCRCLDPRIKLRSGQLHMYLGHSPLMMAVEIQSPEIVEILLQTKKVDVNYVAAGTSNLVLALVKYSDRIAEKLLKAGADPQICNSTGYTPLYYTYNVKSVELLLNYGAHPDGCQSSSCPNRHKRTPLLWFIGHFSNVRSSSIARFLIHRGCDINRRDMETSKTPLDSALEYRQLHIAKALIIYGCDVSKDNFQTLMRVANNENEVMDFCNVWFVGPSPLSHLCCLKIRKILRFDFEAKLNAISTVEIPRPTIRNITMEEIYEEIRGPS